MASGNVLSTNQSCLQNYHFTKPPLGSQGWAILCGHVWCGLGRGSRQLLGQDLYQHPAWLERALLFRSNGGKPCQVKGCFEYHSEGEVFDDMKCWNLPDKPGNATAAVRVEEVYSGAARLL